MELKNLSDAMQHVARHYVRIKKGHRRLAKQQLVVSAVIEMVPNLHPMLFPDSTTPERHKTAVIRVLINGLWIAHLAGLKDRDLQDIDPLSLEEPGDILKYIGTIIMECDTVPYGKVMGKAVKDLLQNLVSGMESDGFMLSQSEALAGIPALIASEEVR